MVGKKALSVVLAAVLLLSTAFAGGAAGWSESSAVNSSTDEITIDTGELPTGSTAVAVNDSVAASSDGLYAYVYGANPETMERYGEMELTRVSVSNTSGGEYIFEINNGWFNNAPATADGGAVVISVVDEDAGTELYSQPVRIDNIDNTNAVVHIGDFGVSDPTGSAVISDSSAIENGTMGGFFGIGGTDVKTVTANGFAEPGTESNVDLKFSGSEEDAIINATDGYEEGEIAPVKLTVNNEKVLVFDDRAPDVVKNQTYGVYNSNDGDIMVHPGGEESSDSVTFDVESHNEPSFWVLFDQLGPTGALERGLPF